MAFRWHPAARVFDGRGRAVAACLTGPAVIADRPSGLALAQALAAGVFRIGGVGAAPESGFQTLTSGSSGTPRRIARSHASWTASFAVNAGLFGIGPGKRVAVLGRLVQSLSLYGAVEAVHLGAEVHLLDDLRPDRQAAALAQRRVQTVYAAPAQLRLLVEAGGDLPELGLVLVGGSKLDAGLRAGLAGLAPGARVVEFYGAAETSFITMAVAGSPPESVGAPYPGVEVQVRGMGGVVAEGERGEIWVRSPYLFDGYAGDEAGGAVWQDGWLSVGEVGHLAGGHLYLAGRAGRMVTVADHNVFPEEIEAFIAALPGVARVAVVPRADARRGVVLVAVVMGDATVEPALLIAVRGRFGALAAPRSVIWRGEWPQLASGKTDLQAIAAGIA